MAVEGADLGNLGIRTRMPVELTGLDFRLSSHFPVISVFQIRICQYQTPSSVRELLGVKVKIPESYGYELNDLVII